MNAPNAYQLWLAMGHKDDLHYPNCSVCKISLEQFSALKKSCTEFLEDTEIERKKQGDDDYFRALRRMGGGSFND